MSDGSEGLRARLTGREEAGIRRVREPVTAGVPLPRGAVRDAGRLVLRVGDRAIPVQAQALERWPDGSVRWALLDFAVDAEPHAEIRVELATADASEAPKHPVRVRRAGSGVFVDAGPAQWTIDPDGPFPFRSARADGTELLAPARCGLLLTREDGRERAAAIRTVETETEGPLRATVRVEGAWSREDGATFLDFVARLHFHAGSPSVRLQLAVRNPRRAAHPGGHWELGDAGSVLFRDLSLRVALARGDRISWSADPSAPLGELREGPLEIVQASSGGENWRSPVHRARDGSVPLPFRGYRVGAPGVQREGLRATPRVAVHHAGGGVSASMRELWQNFPKAMEAGDAAVTVRLFPAGDALHELQGGERKTHEIWLTFGAAATEGAADFQRAPLLLAPDPETFLASGALPYLTLRAEDKNEDACRLAEQAVRGPDSFEAKRERADEYGWRNWGELWADHEARYHQGDDLFVSHFNNQYDPVWGALLRFARDGDVRWLRLMGPLARHAMDIDVYHTDEDRPVYNHGLFWHTAHYVHAGLATHRSYPRGDTVGGGPDDEHNYATGFAHYHLMTGDAWAREAAIERAQWVLDADDGSRTPLRWIAPGSTGLASKTREPGFHGPGRGAGNSIQVLLDAWRLTGERRWLDKAVELIHRTIHPDDDPGAYGLADSETRWSYTAYLQALGRFLDEMAEAGELGEPYAYARASLLTYARWMAEHERPALDFPERLEHPTETWAAQDLRKSEVFRFAMLHSAGEERERFRERAEHFWRKSIDTLDGFDTKDRTRPVVLLMRYGLMQPWFEKHPDAVRPAPELAGAFPPRVRFVPQKARAIQRLRWIAVAGAVVGVVALTLRLI